MGTSVESTYHAITFTFKNNQEVLFVGIIHSHGLQRPRMLKCSREDPTWKLLLFVMIVSCHKLCKVHILLNQRNLTAYKGLYHIVVGFFPNWPDSCLKVKYELWRRNRITFFENWWNFLGQSTLTFFQMWFLFWGSQILLCSKNS